MTTADMLLRLAAGMGLGALIGFERQYRARMAGLRTNALVSAGATLFVLLSAHGFAGATADPTRVAAQIVSGIGFLGGGVILREGLSVRGLNTAATLWCSAAVGALAGAGMFPAAAAGAVAVIVIHVVMRPIGMFVDRRPDTSPDAPTTYTFHALGAEAAEAHIRAVLVDALSRTDLALQSVESTHTNTGGQVQVCAAVTAAERDDKAMETAISRLSIEPAVTSVRWQVDRPAAAATRE
ncbi:MgtC/SapB family protein [Mycolicibacterium sp. J2]|uniref:MgtC/SapB family protein n=1 Tax=Mycolicibacterium sp. J2 TaxID=2993511 RepID=UPI00224B99CF|nr:MgtC/SapB family protein [Mycolicibacterium sp. J2]MCX2714876.1 MgtC/SapB family protein [Mycolicibacterium sp. J2]